MVIAYGSRNGIWQRDGTWSTLLRTHFLCLPEEPLSHLAWSDTLTNVDVAWLAKVSSETVPKPKG